MWAEHGDLLWSGDSHLRRDVERVPAKVIQREHDDDCFLSCRISCRQWNGWRVNERSADTIGVVDEARVLGDHITIIVGNSLGPHLGFTGELHIVCSKVFNAHCTEFHLASWLYVFCKVSLTFCGPGCQAGAEDMVSSSILHKLVHVSCTTSTLLSCKYCSNHEAGVWVAVRGI